MAYEKNLIKLNADRQRVHEIAAKYGLKNNVKVNHLGLIQSAPKETLGIVNETSEKNEYDATQNRLRRIKYQPPKPKPGKKKLIPLPAPPPEDEIKLTTTAGEETEREMSATAVIAHADGKFMSAKKVQKNQQDLDENAADDEDNEVDVSSTAK